MDSLGYFGFLRAGEFTATGIEHSASSSLQIADVTGNSHPCPSVIKVWLKKAKTDPFGKGVNIYLGKSGRRICPVAAILNYIAIRGPSEGQLLIHQDGTPLTRDCFICKVKKALGAAGIDQSKYAGHSLRIGAATAVAAAGIPAHVIKMMGRWSSKAYLLYIRTPRETLAAVSALISH